MKKIALFPGSFDPFTLGHLETLKKGCKLFDQVIIAVMTNTNKNSLFSYQEKKLMIEDSTIDLNNISVIEQPNRLTTQVAKELGANFLLRGIRNVRDFEYEADISNMNHSLDPEIETIFLIPSKEFTFISSTIIKEVSLLGGDISRFVPEPVLMKLKEKMSLNER